MNWGTLNAIYSTVKNYFFYTREAYDELIRVEKSLMASCGVEYESKFVRVRFKYGDMYTVSVKPRQEMNPNNEAIVFIPGLGAGTAMFAANFMQCAKTHPVHAFDPLGFGRSYRVDFFCHPSVAELEMVEAMEDWRKAMGIEKMYIVAHSFGAYLASAYALEHPSRVAHMILIEPWGFAEKVEASEKLPKHLQIKPYPWMEFLGGLAGYFNPFTMIRVMGPWAPGIIRKLRPDLAIRFPGMNEMDIYKYVYYLNLADPTGETAYMSMTLPVGWAKRPMIKRFNGIDKNVGVTFIYGSKSWHDPGPAVDIQHTREGGYVDIKIIRGAGHHPYADVSEEVNDIILDVVEGRLAKPSNQFEIEEPFSD